MANIIQSAQTNDFFFPLDNSAVFIASTTCKTSPYVYRVSCELDELIFLPALEEALAAVTPRFPFLSTELRAGLFWYYLDPLKTPLRLYADSRFPAEYHPLMRRGRYLFRVRAYASRLSCEFHHALTDGFGAIEFLRSLIAAYLTVRGVRCDDWEGIRKPGSAVNPGELADAYAGLSRKSVPLPDPLPPAFQLPGSRYRGQAYRVTTGTLSLASALKTARERKVSITELLSSVYLASLQDVFEERQSGRWKPICVQVPVNMRKFHPSPTLRNFFLFITVSIDRRLGHYEFDEILERVHCQFKLNLTGKELDRQIRRNVRGEEIILSRIVPLHIKNVVLRIISRLASDKPFSGNISNVQAVAMPDAFAAHIRRFDMLPSRKTAVGANIGVISWKDMLSVTVGSLVIDRSFERYFFARCAGLGIPVTVESNI